MIYVFLCSPTNSTMFTNCCEAAILDREWKCPGCGKEVYPGKNCNEHERGRLRWSWAYRGPKIRTDEIARKS